MANASESQGSLSASFSDRQDTNQYHSLSADGHYLCPVCRHGQISQLTLMEAFSCSFCRHIFDISYDEQLVWVVDSAQPATWRWDGDRWQTSGPQPEAIAIWIIALILAIVPFSLLGLAVYVFPPLPGSRWAWLPMVWALGALLIHVTLAVWITVEYYQPPLYAANKVRLRRWLFQIQSLQGG
ncbi:MAG: hypothetical protein WBA10_02625 [Elainellaceae cyanobacterium]